jgi:hypothetical protein
VGKNLPNTPIHAGILLRFVGTALGVTVGVDLLIWGHGKSSTGGGDRTVHSHEWRVMTKDGRPGARVGPATAKDLYEHYHGHGSWDRRNSRIKTNCIVLAAVVVFACPLLEIPFLQRAGARGFSAIVGYFLIYRLLPLALLGVAAYWLVRWTPRLR